MCWLAGVGLNGEVDGRGASYAGDMVRRGTGVNGTAGSPFRTGGVLRGNIILEVFEKRI